MGKREYGELPSTTVEIEGTDLARHLPWFEETLAANGIAPPRGSALRSALDALRLLRGNPDEPLNLTPDELVDATAVAFMVSAARQLSARAPESFRESLRIFRGQDILLAREGDRNRIRDIAFEVFCAGLASVGATTPPTLGGHENPDVRFRVREIEWGIECKVMYTRRIENARREIGRKISQAAECDVDRAVILVDVTPIVDHARESQFRAPRENAADRIQRQVFNLSQACFNDELREKLEAAGPKVAGVVIAAHSAFLAAESPALLCSLHFVASKRIDFKGRAFLQRLKLGYRKVMLQEG